MGIDLMEIGVCLRKGLIISARTCYRSANNHPFFMGFVLFFFFLYRCLPFVFSFLVSSSPVLVCTFALLGTLLSYGHPNIPEIEEEKEDEKTRETQHEISSLKSSGFIESDLVVEKDEGVSVETHVQNEVKERDWAFPMPKDDDLITERTSLIEKEPEDEGTHSQYQLITEERDSYSQEFLKKRDLDELDEAEPLYKQEFGAKRELDHLDELKPLMGDSSDEDEVQSSYGVKKEIEPLLRVEESSDNEHLDELPVSTPHFEDHHPFGSAQDSSSWKKIEDHDDDEFSDSESDGAESSSPDASMTDIIPMLDELHPLLDLGTPQPAHISSVDNEFDATSERSHGDNVELGMEAENQEEEDDDDDDDDDEEEEEEKQESNDNGGKAVVTWTEDDEKNLMDLGNSELERNRRLESLIARRRARKNFRMMEAEKNMIDLDFNGPPFHITPISTTRRNPFDLHYDSNMGMDLPPIPGSAPSVLLPRRNPFDIPYEPHEERPDLTGGSFNEEFTTAQERDMYFRRHESFHLGSFFYEEQKQEKRDVKFRPYFVPEHSSDGVGLSRFHRQMSDRSDSKMSFATETESISSIANEEDNRSLVEEQESQECEPITHIGITERKIQEGESSTHVDNTADLVKLESQYSNEVDLNKIDQEDTRGIDLSRNEAKNENEENAHETLSGLLDSEFVASSSEPNTSNDQVNPEVDEKHYTRSNSSSSSDLHEKIFDVNIDEELANLEQIGVENDEYNDNDEHPMLTETEMRSAERINPTEEPVYDLSPSATERNISSLISMEEWENLDQTRASTSSEVVSTPVMVERTVLLTDEEPSVRIGSPREITPAYERSWSPSPELCPIDENESSLTDITQTSEHEVIEVGSSDINQNFDDLVEHVLPSVIEQDASEHIPSSSESESEKEGSLCDEENLQFEQEQIPSFSSTQEIGDGVHQTHGNDKLDAVATSYPAEVSSENISSLLSEEQPPLMEEMIVQPSSDVKCEESQERSVVPEILITEASVSGEVNEQKDDDLPSFTDLLDFTPTAPYASEDQLNQMLFGDNSHDEIQYDSKYQVPREFDFYHEEPGRHITEEELDEENEGIEEMDEALLSELDVVGDFSFNEKEANTNQSEKEMEVDGLQTLIGSQVHDSFDDLDKLEAVEKSTFQENEDESPEFSLLAQETNLMDKDLELPVLEAKSLEDIDSAFRQLREEELVGEPLHDESMVEETQVMSAESFKQLRGETLSSEVQDEPEAIETNLEMPVLEARSLEDIDSAFKQLREGEAEKSDVLELIHDEPMTEETGAVFAEHTEQLLDEPLSETIERKDEECELPTQEQNMTDTDVELPVLEARSLEDIDSVLKELHEEDLKSSIVFPQVNTEPKVEEIENVDAEFDLRTQETDLLETNFEVPVPRALGIINSASEQLRDGEAENSVFSEAATNELILEETAVRSADLIEQPHDSLFDEIENVDTDFKLPSEETNMSETNFEVPVPKSLEAVDLASEQLGEAENFVAPEAVDDELISEEAKVVVAESSYQSEEEPLLEEVEEVGADAKLPIEVHSLLEINLGMPVVEARSLEDIDSALELLHEREAEISVVSEAVHNEPISEEVEDVHADTELSIQDHTPSKTSLEMEVLEARSLEDIDSAFKHLRNEKDETAAVPVAVRDEPILEEAEIESPMSSKQPEDKPQVKEVEDEHAVALPVNEPSLIDTNSELPVLEARSLKDIDFSFEQLHKSETESPIVDEAVQEAQVGSSESTEEVLYEPLMKETGDSCAEFVPVEERSPIATDLVLPIVEARSLEDIDFAFKQLHKGETELSIVDDAVQQAEVEASESTEEVRHEALMKETGASSERYAEFVPVEEPTLIETNLPLPIVEARSLQDIDFAFKQLHKGEAESSIIQEAVQETQIESSESSEEVQDGALIEDIGDSPLEFSMQTEEPQLLHTNSELQIVEARSFDDIDSAFKQLHEEKVESSVVHEEVQDESILDGTEVECTDSFELVHDDSLLKESGDGHVEFAVIAGEPHLGDTSLDLPVLEARSLADIDSAFAQISKDEAKDSHTDLKPVHDESVSDESKLGFGEVTEETNSDSLVGVKPAESNLTSELPIQEARSLEETDSTLHDGGKHEKSTHELAADEPQVLVDVQNSTQTLTESQILAEEVNLPEKQQVEGKVEDLLKPYESDDEWTEVSQKDLLGSSKETMSGFEEIGQETRPVLGESSSNKAGSKKESTIEKVEL